MRRPRLPLGLRPRIFGALALTSVVTLAVAAAAVLAPLEQRLRRGERDALLDDAAAARPVLARAAGVHGARELRAVVQRMERRTDARIAVLDRTGRVLASAGLAPGEGQGDAAAALARARGDGPVVLRTGGGDRLAVLLPVRSHGRRLGVVLRRSAVDARVGARIVRRAFFVAAAVSLLVVALLGRALTGRLLRRLQRLRRTASAMAELSAPVELAADGARDEVGDLVRALAAMQVRLQRQEDARRAFVSTASHELRTPLAMVGMTLELAVADLEGGEPDVDDARALLERALEQSRRLGRLAGDLLDLSRIDADVPLREEPVELGELCRATLAEFAPRAAGDVELRFAAPEEACWGLGDPGSIARILRILVDNALRATPPGGRVEVAVRCDGTRARLRVSDTGPGIAPGEEARIFERFVRGARPAGGAGGFGLGLAIGRELARRMGGELVLEAPWAAPGAGARFSLCLPGAPADPGEPAARAASGTPSSG
jgi:signal transduction histidine kinase